jgi:hypothetical protein
MLTFNSKFYPKTILSFKNTNMDKNKILLHSWQSLLVPKQSVFLACNALRMKYSQLKTKYHTGGLNPVHRNLRANIPYEIILKKSTRHPPAKAYSYKANICVGDYTHKENSFDRKLKKI